MKQIKLNPNNQRQVEKAASASAEALRNSGVIVYPTDTLYGLGANGFDEKAILKVFEIKKQNHNKPMSVIVKDMKMARRIAYIDSKTEKFLNRIWPGPITVVLRKKDIIPCILTGNEETIGIRIPKSDFISKLAENLDFPITATSANISGENNLLHPSEIIEKFSNSEFSPDLFINSGEIKNPAASTIVDLSRKTPKILREGIIGKKKTQELFKKFI